MGALIPPKPPAFQELGRPGDGQKLEVPESAAPAFLSLEFKS